MEQRRHPEGTRGALRRTMTAASGSVSVEVSSTVLSSFSVLIEHLSLRYSRNRDRSRNDMTSIREMISDLGYSARNNTDDIRDIKFDPHQADVHVERMPLCAKGCSASRACGRGARRPGGGEDGVADLPLQAPQALPACLSLGRLLVVISAVLVVRLAELGDRGHVYGMVDPPVSAPAQPVGLRLPEETSMRTRLRLSVGVAT